MDAFCANHLEKAPGYRKISNFRTRVRKPNIPRLLCFNTRWRLTFFSVYWNKPPFGRNLALCSRFPSAS
jgi:hypothetical protein